MKTVKEINQALSEIRDQANRVLITQLQRIGLYKFKEPIYIEGFPLIYSIFQLPVRDGGLWSFGIVTGGNNEKETVNVSDLTFDEVLHLASLMEDKKFNSKHNSNLQS